MEENIKMDTTCVFLLHSFQSTC